MVEKRIKKLNSVFYELISAAIITYSVIPGFRNIGHLFYQVALTAFIVVVFLVIADDRKIKPSTVARSLVFMTLYWVGYALISQIKLHQKLDDKTFNWLYLFYYDKPAMLIVVYFSVFLFFAFRLIKNYNNSEFLEQYKRFQKIALIAFTAYYFLIIFYCFYLVRADGNASCPVNLIPFNVFNVMKAGEYEYEFIFLFFGNIAIFMPLGFFIPAFMKNKFVIFILPFILSIGIEVSQYLLHNGQPDIDDVILNVIGYYIGYLMKVILDKVVFKCSKGQIGSVFLVKE